MKLLKAFPFDTWIQTADNPSLLDPPLCWLYLVKITWMNQTGVKPHVFSVNNGEAELHLCDACTREMEAAV